VLVTSAQVIGSPPSSRNGSTEGPPGYSSIAPSSPRRPLAAPPSTPTTVQYGCSPEKPRGNAPRGTRLASACKSSVGVSTSSASSSSSSASAYESPWGPASGLPSLMLIRR
jgi:hypothetical protein